MSGPTHTSRVSIEYFRSIEADSLPIAKHLGIELSDLGRGRAWATARYQSEFLRPGGTISGPVMMALADYVSYAAILSEAGPLELAVTSNLNITFLRKPKPGDLVAHATVAEVQNGLAYADVRLYSANETLAVESAENNAILVAQSSVIYVLPDARV